GVPGRGERVPDRRAPAVEVDTALDLVGRRGGPEEEPRREAALPSGAAPDGPEGRRPFRTIARAQVQHVSFRRRGGCWGRLRRGSALPTPARKAVNGRA